MFFFLESCFCCVPGVFLQGNVLTMVASQGYSFVQSHARIVSDATSYGETSEMCFVCSSGTRLTTPLKNVA